MLIKVQAILKPLVTLCTVTVFIPMNHSKILGSLPWKPVLQRATTPEQFRTPVAGWILGPPPAEASLPISWCPHITLKLFVHFSSIPLNLYLKSCLNNSTILQRWKGRVKSEPATTWTISYKTFCYHIFAKMLLQLNSLKSAKQNLDCWAIKVQCQQWHAYLSPAPSLQANVKEKLNLNKFILSITKML